MIRQANIFAILFICISHILFANAGLPGGYSPVAESQLGSLQAKLQNSNFQTALGTKDSGAKVVKINSAYQQVVAGMNYQINATVLVNKEPQNCCFEIFQSLPPVSIKVNCAQCGSTCECFKKNKDVAKN